MTGDDRLMFLSSVMALEPPMFLFGGVAEDALLYGTWARPHVDIDVLVHRPDLDRQLAAARTIGFREFEVRFEPLPDTPVVLGCVEDGRNLEISVYDRTPAGRAFFYMVDAAGQVVRIVMTEDIFDHPPSVIDGVHVRTISPLGQYQIRAGIAAAGGFGPLRPKDVEAQRALQERFFLGVDPEDLRPYVGLLSDGPT